MGGVALLKGEGVDFLMLPTTLFVALAVAGVPEPPEVMFNATC